MRTVLLVLAMTSATAVAGHDFWVQPRDFVANPGVAVPMTIEVGHGPARQRWSAPIDRITTFAALGPGGTKDIRAALRPAGGPMDASVSFSAPGSYIVILETTRAESNLPAIRFNDYIKAEGITPAIVARAKGTVTDTPGRELYSRRAKALVRIGEGVGPQPQITRPVGLTLEIVPAVDPTAPGFTMTLPVTIMYHGRPLSGALVKLNNLDFDARPVETHLTDEAGRATFTIPFKGEWQMNVVWTQSIKDPRADFDTVFSSLTFGQSRAAGR